MIVHDLNVLRARSRPAEAHAELIAYTDTVLPGAVALERFQPVARRHPEVFQPAAICNCRSLRRATDSMLTNRLKGV